MDLLPSAFPVQCGATMFWPNYGSRLIHMLAFLGLQSPLEYIATQSHILSMRNILRRQLNVTDIAGSPLMYALAGCQMNTVQFLVQAGVRLTPKKRYISSPESPVVFACQNPDPEYIELLISRGSKINTVFEGCHALRSAIMSGNTVAIKMLFGPDLKAPKIHDQSPRKVKSLRQNYRKHLGRRVNLDGRLGAFLELAIASGNEVVVNMLLDRWEMLKASNSISSTLLEYALQLLQEPTKIALLLLDRGVNPNIALNGFPSEGIRTPLQFAIKTDDEVLLKALLDRGATTHTKNGFGMSPLYYAASIDRWEICKIILDSGAHPNSREGDGDTPLHLAANAGGYSIVASLIESGAQLSARNDDGETPFDIALQRGNFEIMELFISAGCDIKARSERKDGKPPLHLAASSPNGAAVSFLIQQGADINATCPRGTTALHWAKTSKAVERLIAAGMTIDSKDCMGCTPLHFAANRGNAKVVAMLLEKGADAIVDAKSLLGETPLHHAVSPQVVRLLVEADANLESRDRWGRTPLYQAAHRQETLDFGTKQRQDYDAMTMLRQKGADENAEDYIGDSAIPDPEIFLMPQPRPPSGPPSFHTTGPGNVG